MVDHSDYALLFFFSFGRDLPAPYGIAKHQIAMTDIRSNHSYVITNYNGKSILYSEPDLNSNKPSMVLRLGAKWSNMRTMTS